MDELRPVGENDSHFIFIKWSGVPTVPITHDIVEGLLSSHAQLKYVRLLPMKTYGYAEFMSEEDARRTYTAVDNFVFKGATFRAGMLPTEPVYVPTSRNPDDAKFRADLNKTIKARAHDRKVFQQSTEKLIKKAEIRKKVDQAEREFAMRREQEKQMMKEAEQRMAVPSVATVNMALPVRLPANDARQHDIHDRQAEQEHVDDMESDGSYTYTLADMNLVLLRITSEIRHTLGPNIRVEFDTPSLEQLVWALKITPLPEFPNTEVLEKGFSISPALDFIRVDKAIDRTAT